MQKHALSRLKKGDVLVVWRLDRLGRSLAHLIGIIAGPGPFGVGFASLTEAIETTTAGGRLVFHSMGALAEFERGLIADHRQVDWRGEGVPLPRTRIQVVHGTVPPQCAGNRFPARSGLSLIHI